ncbi:MAG: hypothetical protein LBT70_04130 [Holosporaceae bacterium]|jgi:hypothetical protein|nr:hypothetical protein [Holosporaceae bacterium]
MIKNSSSFDKSIDEGTLSARIRQDANSCAVVRDCNGSKTSSSQNFSQDFCEEDPLGNNYACNIDSIIDAMGIMDNKSDMPPVLDEERATAKLQFLVAQILVRDLVLIKMDKSKRHASDEMLINELSRIFADNVACIAKEILYNDIFKLNVLDVLKDFNGKL